MVYIKKAEIYGFKSFGYKNTVVNFEPGLVAISGPNGSGKSNILDAIIFALGENSPKMMRVDKLRSLLHDVDGSRHGTKVARVSCHFDNLDRKLPVDSNTVTITRELGESGENVYYLNQKKVQRNQILDLLDIANAGASTHKLNIVQQGTITRISEFNAEERRKIIEDIVGLAYFDEKKTESMKQLDEADRRLEIALARMDEIKKRIDELEEERNLQLRYEFIEKELRRFHAVRASNRLEKIEQDKKVKQEEFDRISSELNDLGTKHEELKKNIDYQENEKQKFMDEANNYNQAKASIDSQLSESMQNSEEAASVIATSKRRISQIDSRQQEINEEVNQFNDKIAEMQEKISEIQNTLSSTEDKKTELTNRVASFDKEIRDVMARQSEIANRKLVLEEKVKKIQTSLNEAKLNLSRLESEKSDSKSRLQSNSEKVQKMNQDHKKFLELFERLHRIQSQHEKDLSRITSKLDSLYTKKNKLEQDIDDNSLILNKAEKAAVQYGAKIQIVEKVLHEDYSIAQLKNEGKRLGIRGMVYEMINWDKKYERAILAVASDWLKGMVVNDFDTLLGLASYVHNKKLPKVRIIPLDAIPSSKISMKNIPELKTATASDNQSTGSKSSFYDDDIVDSGKYDVMGVLADFVECNTQLTALKNFLFGNVILTKSKEAAHKLSRLGYRAVTVSGEFFEVQSNAMVVDINSKISNLTKIIMLSTSVTGLSNSLGVLRKYIKNRKAKLESTNHEIQNLEKKKTTLESGISNIGVQKEHMESRKESLEELESSLNKRIEGLNKRILQIETTETRLQSYIESLQERIAITQDNYKADDESWLASRISYLNSAKSELLDEQTSVFTAYREQKEQLRSLENELDFYKNKISKLRSEYDELEDEKKTTESRIKEATEQKQRAEEQLVKLRQQEQELISNSGTSVEKLKEYDQKLKELYESDKELSKSIHKLERQHDSLDRDLQELREEESKLKSKLSSYGYDSRLQESFEVEHIIQKLESEKQNLIGSLNRKAPETYFEVSDGYRSMSSRKNELEEERNSIVRFIEEIDKDKRQTFLEAYDKVDKDIRESFSRMTGGNAWLELQNEDDIFSSGISYLIQFPNKQKRESTAISGGEKTLAAIVFLLALQRLKPSPFYLLDEVDAHLDALNTDRLSKIIEERSKDNQMLMVSLKDSTVSKANLVYGVYPRNGVSQIISYKKSSTTPMTN